MGYTPPQLDVRKIAGGWSMTPPSNVTGDDLTIYPNATDVLYSQIKLLGAGTLELTGGSININTTGNTFTIGSNVPSTHCYIQSKVNNYDLLLLTTGTGVVKFGTYTANADVPCDGWITIKDQNGNTRKLMTTA